MTRSLFTLPLLCLSLLITAQDSLALPAVTVQAYRGQTTAERIPASVATLGPEAINEYPGNNLLPAMNRLPGVRFEQRAPGSYRISVRGSTLRSPFGVRNIKVYWNGIPFTEPGGDTQLNFLDVANIDRLELIKGPAGSLYGAGTAGTLLLSTDSLRSPAGAEIAGGSFGFFRARAQVQSKGARSQFRFAYQGTNGYRDHSSLDRNTYQYRLNLGGGAGRDVKLHALYTNLSYDLPGGLNAEQYAENPRQARPGSAETNASINYNNLLLGLTQNVRLGNWTNESTAYATGFYFDHPFNFDYKRETNLGAGGRTAFDRTVYLNGGALKFSAGGEYQFQRRMANNFGNDDAAPGELNFSDEIVSRQTIAFGQATYSTNSGWRLTAGLSANGLLYNVDRTYDADGNEGTVVSDFGTELSPRLAVLKTIGTTNVYASVARGFSPPTLDEFRTNEGSINTGLNPERGTNFEIGVKASTGRLAYEVTGFYFRLSETITTFSDARGTRLFRNAGATDQYGLELAATYRVNPWLELYGSYTYHNFSYADFSRDEVNVSGQRLPGTAPHVANLIVDVGRPTGFFGSLNYNYTDAIPLNDANTVFGEAYHLVRARAGWRGSRWEVYVAGSNLLDERMSFGNDLNPRFGGRYFQPAPGVNGLLGVRWGIN